jgi:hypothetical protein
VPRIQRLGDGYHLVHRGRRIDQAVVTVAIQVLAHQPQPQIACELAGVIQYRAR